MTYNRHIGLALLPSKKGFKCLGLSILNLGYSKIVKLRLSTEKVKLKSYLDIEM